ncbi:MAG: imidazolonepropionase [Burkholderiaceae bacterium]
MAVAHTNVDCVIENCHAATLEGAGYGIVDDALVALAGDRIAWVGQRPAAPSFPTASRFDAQRGWLTPGLIDCHTHLVYGGDRAHEFELRLQGATYEQVARAGGGIVSTVKATREASEQALAAAADKRLATLIAEGVTTIEIKSGYGLSTDDELKMLRVARSLAGRRAVRVRTTLLAAHALPAEYAGRADAYIDLVCNTIVPAAAREGLADAVDAFCEGIGFSNAQCARVFDAAQAAGLPVKLHADQLSNLGGAALAAHYRGLSADHLEYTDTAGVTAMAAAGTVAVLLPGAFHVLREKQLPPIEALREHRVPIALATDCNPGSSPLLSPLLTMNLACTLFRLTPEEALAGFTRHAATALGLQHETGRIAPGLAADLALWEIGRPAELAYMLGARPLRARWFGGEVRVMPAL